MKVKKITKIAKIQPIESTHNPRCISVICKILESTENSDFEEPKSIEAEKVPEKNYKRQVTKASKK
jgi:hypothetical protein